MRSIDHIEIGVIIAPPLAKTAHCFYILHTELKICLLDMNIKVYIIVDMKITLYNVAMLYSYILDCNRKNNFIVLFLTAPLIYECNNHNTYFIYHKPTYCSTSLGSNKCCEFNLNLEMWACLIERNKMTHVI